MNISADTLDLLGRFGIDILAMMLLVGVLYRSQQSVPSMPLVLSALNFGLFGALAAITAGTFNAAIGFGLFGLLSMLRLRSAAFTIKDVAYTFLALIFGLINGLPDRPIALLIIVNVGILIVVAVTDNSRGDSPTRVMRLTLEHAYSDPAEVRSRPRAEARRQGHQHRHRGHRLRSRDHGAHDLLRRRRSLGPRQRRAVPG